MYHKILIASDPEGLAEQTVPVVAALVHGTDAAVRVVAVDEEVASAGRRWGVGEHLERIVTELRSQGVNAECVVRTSHRDHISEQIAAAAREWGADLIVLGSHRRGDLRSLFVGSVGHALARRTRTPLLFAGSQRAATTPQPPAPDHRCVLVAVDYDKASQHAIQAAIGISGPKTQVHVIHVETLPGTGSTDGYLPRDLVERDEEAGRYVVEGALQQFADHGIDADWEIFEPPGATADVIVRTADKVEADVIVLGSRRLATVWAVVAGSVAQRQLEARGIAQLRRQSGALRGYVR